MGRCVLSFQNYVADVTTAINANGAEVFGLSAARLKDTQVRKRWRTPLGTIAPNLDLDFGYSRAVDVVAFAQPVDAGLLDGNRQAAGFMAPSDTVRHQFSNAVAGAADVYDTGVVACNVKAEMGVHARVLPAQISARFWRMSPNAASLAGSVNYLDIGVAWCGKKFVPKKNMQFGYNWSFGDLSSVSNVQTSGLDYVRYGFKRRNIVFSFDALDADDAEIISMMQRYVGTSGQVLFIPDPDDVVSDFAQPIIGRLTDSNPTAHPSYGIYTKSFSLLQSL